MIPIEVLTLVETEFELTMKSNQIHRFTFYFIENKMVTYANWLKNNNIYKNTRVIHHVGIKFPVTDRFWAFSAFTSQEKTTLWIDTQNQIEIININVSQYGSIHRNMNEVFLVSNQFLSEYATISNNINTFSNTYWNPSINPTDNIRRLVIDSIESYKMSIRKLNIDNINVLIDTFYKYYMNLTPESSNIVKIYEDIENKVSQEEKIEKLKEFGINIDNLYNFIENLEKNKTIYGKSLYETELFMENSDRRILTDVKTKNQINTSIVQHKPFLF